MPDVANVLDIPSNPPLLHPPSSPPSNEPHFISLTPLLVELAYLAILFILGSISLFGYFMYCLAGLHCVPAGE